MSSQVNVDLIINFNRNNIGRMDVLYFFIYSLSNIQNSFKLAIKLFFFILPFIHSKIKLYHIPNAYLY